MIRTQRRNESSLKKEPYSRNDMEKLANDKPEAREESPTIVPSYQHLNGRTDSRKQGGSAESSSDRFSRRLDSLEPAQVEHQANQHSSFFSSSSNFKVVGSHFNSFRDHVSTGNVFINVNPGPESNDSVSVRLPTRYMSKNNRAETNNIEIEPSKRPKLEVRKSSEIYFRHLLTVGRGSPLWIPEPSNTLPVEYQKTGIRIGDVGLLKESGGFDFLFNVYQPRNDAEYPINPRTMPDGFLPLDPPEERDVDSHVEFKNHSFLTSSHVLSRHDASSGFMFESSAEDGAILTMPNGANSADLDNMAMVRKYVSINVKHWYTYANETRGRDAHNGDIRLVIGKTSTSTWGMATFANEQDLVGKGSGAFSLKFKPSESGEGGTHASGARYTWEYSGKAEVKSGPDEREIEKLRELDRRRGGEGQTAYENQCLFVRTINVTLGRNTVRPSHPNRPHNAAQHFADDLGIGIKNSRRQAAHNSSAYFRKPVSVKDGLDVNMEEDESQSDIFLEEDVGTTGDRRSMVDDEESSDVGSNHGSDPAIMESSLTSRSMDSCRSMENAVYDGVVKEYYESSDHPHAIPYSPATFWSPPAPTLLPPPAPPRGPPPPLLEPYFMARQSLIKPCFMVEPSPRTGPAPRTPPSDYRGHLQANIKGHSRPDQVANRYGGRPTYPPGLTASAFFTSNPPVNVSRGLSLRQLGTDLPVDASSRSQDPQPQPQPQLHPAVPRWNPPGYFPHPLTKPDHAGGSLSASDISSAPEPAFLSLSMPPPLVGSHAHSQSHSQPQPQPQPQPQLQWYVPHWNRPGYFPHSLTKPDHAGGSLSANVISPVAPKPAALTYFPMQQMPLIFGSSNLLPAASLSSSSHPSSPDKQTGSKSEDPSGPQLEALHHQGITVNGEAEGSSRPSRTPSPFDYQANDDDERARLPLDGDLHPSSVINAFLLNSVPEADMAITEDGNWISVLQRSDLVFPSDDVLITRIQEMYEVRVEDGVVFLQRRSQISAGTGTEPERRD